MLGLYVSKYQSHVCSFLCSYLVDENAQIKNDHVHIIKLWTDTHSNAKQILLSNLDAVHI